MIDWKNPLEEQQRQDREDAAIAALEKHSAQFQWALIGCIAVLLLSFTVGLVQGHFERYNSLSANNEALVQCLNGHLVNVDNVLVSCSMHTSQLVADATNAKKVTVAQAEVLP